MAKKECCSECTYWEWEIHVLQENQKDLLKQELKARTMLTRLMIKHHKEKSK